MVDGDEYFEEEDFANVSVSLIEAILEYQRNIELEVKCESLLAHFPSGPLTAAIIVECQKYKGHPGLHVYKFENDLGYLEF